MFGTKKQWGHILKSITSISFLLILFACGNSKNKSNNAGVVFTGNTQGTTYTIILAEEEAKFNQKEIDSILHAFDMSLSTYVPESVISTLNNSKDTVVIDQSGFFKRCYTESLEAYNRTKGQFDPSVFPLVEGWGFMKDLKTPLSREKVDSIMQFVGMSKELCVIEFKGDSIQQVKKDERFKLDFNAIAQGLSVDVLSDFISSRGHKNFYVEIGGEMMLKGLNREGKDWRIGIDVPKEKVDPNVRQLENVLSISNKAIATSGNYRKFYEVDGKKYAHTLDPKTGYPVKHNLLSATVISENASTSDAYATAFMVMGLEATKEFLEENKDLGISVYLLYDNEGQFGRWYSEEVEDYLK